jgi:hypothetical protein
MCWYWKINEMVLLLKSIDNKLFDNKLSNNDGFNSSNKTAQDGIPAALSIPKTSGTGSIYEALDTKKLLNDIESQDYSEEAKNNMRNELLARYKISFKNNKFDCGAHKFNSLSEAVNFNLGLRVASLLLETHYR